MTPWGVQPDGTTLTPAPGMLVAFETGWAVIHHTDMYPMNGMFQRELDQIFVQQITMHTTYLAPAPTPGGLQAALTALLEHTQRGAGVPGYADRNARVHHSPDILTRIAPDGTCTLHFYNAPAFSTPDELALLDSARQRHGALLQYCAQEGWE